MVDLGDKEYVADCTFVGLSRVRSIDDLALKSMTFSRLQSISNCKNLQKRLPEEQRLSRLAHNTQLHFRS